MKKNYTVILAVFLGFVFSFLSISNYEKKQEIALNNISELSAPGRVDLVAENLDMVKAQLRRRDNSIKTASKNTSERPREVRTVASRGATTKAPGTATKGTTSSKYGELLDWWTQAQKIFSIGTVAEVTDIRTGKTFKIKRTMGAYHADCEALTKADADIIRGIWGGFSWDVRPVVVNVRGRKIAASMSSLPHAGVDAAPAFAVVNNRSEGYGTGENLDTIKGNGMNGHFDVHFLNSKRHKDNRVDPRHQAAVYKAAGK